MVYTPQLSTRYIWYFDMLPADESSKVLGPMTSLDVATVLLVGSHAPVVFGQ